MIDINVETLLQENGIDYHDHGHYVKIHCINPAHDDAHPSMTILKESGFARCWSCGATYKYGQLVYHLTGKAPFSNKNKYSFRFNTTLNTPVKKTFKKVERKLRIEGRLDNPHSNPEVMKFLRQLSITDNMIQQFYITYMIKGSMAFIETEKITPIYNRVCIPLYEGDHIVNVECRDFTGRGKPKVLYPKGAKSDILFNINNLDFVQPLYIVEGIKSALRIYSLGYTNVTATLGATIGKNQARLINSMRYPIIFPDNDDAGKGMIRKIDEMTDVDYCVTFMSTEGYDPADGSVDELQYALHNYIGGIQYYLNKYPIFRSKEKIVW
jgi:DNA primase